MTVRAGGSQGREDDQRLRDRADRLRIFAEAPSEGVAVLEGAVLADTNERFDQIFGYGPGELVGRNASELVVEADWRAILESIRSDGIVPCEAECLRKDGTVFPIELSVRSVSSGRDQLRVVAVRDITRRKQIERAIQISQRLLVLANRRQDMTTLLEAFVEEVQRLTGFTAVGIRLLEEDGAIPYRAWRGFTPAFYASENPLSIHHHACMCINVIQGDTDPALPFYTEGGSFFVAGTSRFLEEVSPESLGSSRNVCHHEGFESVALLPIRSGSRILGLIHLADTREDSVSLEWVRILEGAAVHLGTALERVWVEESLKKAYADLERRVEARTAELVSANEQLTEEIHERRRTEEQLQKLNRAHKTLGACNRALIHSKDQSRLINDICRIAVEVGGYRLVWVGSAQEDDRRSVLPVAQFGFEEGYLERIRVSWGDEESGRGPTGTAIRSGRPAIARDILQDPAYEPWRAEAHKRGYSSSIALPLRCDGKVLGALNLYAEEADAFDDDEVALLTELADNLAYGITVWSLSDERRRAEEALRRSEDELRELSSRLLTAEEEERKRISREIHDGIGQSLSAIKFRLETSLHGMGEKVSTETLRGLEAIVPMIQGAIEEVRRVSRDLRPPTLDDLGILATIAWFCREYQEVYGEVEVQKVLEIEEEAVPYALKTVLYRVIQEAFNNIAKHSGADRVVLSLRSVDGGVELAVRDNGSGFEPDAEAAGRSARSGLGLASMRERVERLGGVFRIDSRPGGGTCVHARWSSAALAASL